MTRPDGHEWFGFSDDETAWTCAAIPDYLNSLDAMSEAEKIITGAQERKWIECLSIAVHGELRKKTSNLMARATAPQRAEALLKTLGLWEEV